VLLGLFYPELLRLGKYTRLHASEHLNSNRWPELQIRKPTAAVDQWLKIQSSETAMTNYFFEAAKYPLPSEKLVATLESLVGYPLPSSYRSYLTQYNGAKVRHKARPDSPVFVRVQWKPEQPMKDESSEAVLHQWGCLLQNPDAPENVLASNLREKYLDFDGRIPKCTLPFLNDSGGSLFLILLSGSMAGSIVYWDRNWEGDAIDAAGQATLANIGLIANSFDEFLSRIEPQPDDWAAWEAKGKPPLP
jgi:SMI1 / KNR4 family (SUKH-1)